jgi:hypothetical protein
LAALAQRISFGAAVQQTIRATNAPAEMLYSSRPTTFINMVANNAAAPAHTAMVNNMITHLTTRMVASVVGAAVL